MTRTVAAAVTLSLLSGCAFVPFRHHRASARAEKPVPAAPPTEIAVGEPAPGGACRLDTLKVLEGRPGSAVLAAQALDLSGARVVRWMRPGDMVTMDYRADRLNIRLTRGNAVKSFACG